MRRAELVAHLREKLRRFWPNELDGVIQALIDLVIDRTAAGDEVTLHGFGTFRVVELKPKRVVTKGVARIVPARRVLKFTASRKLRGLGREGGEQ